VPILATRASERVPRFTGIDRAMRIPGVDVRIFGKPSTRPYRRMGVALAVAPTLAQARRNAARAAACVSMRYA
jgi:phosphoribosylglycinamide formyltransferase 2